MRTMVIGFLTAALLCSGSGEWPLRSVEKALSTSATPAPGEGPPVEAVGAGSPAAPAGGPMLGPATPPLELVASTPKGELKNPYNADITAIAEEGHHRFLSAGCNGCHGGGGGGGGGMCPPLTNDNGFTAATTTRFSVLSRLAVAKRNCEGHVLPEIARDSEATLKAMSELEQRWQRSTDDRAAGFERRGGLGKR
jgi:hypothetical protein